MSLFCALEQHMIRWEYALQVIRQFSAFLGKELISHTNYSNKTKTQNKPHVAFGMENASSA